MPFTISMTPNASAVTVYGDAKGLVELSEIIARAVREGSANVAGPDGKAVLTIVREKNWRPR